MFPIVTADEWNDEMEVAAEELNLDGDEDIYGDDPPYWTDDDFYEWERQSIEAEQEAMNVPSWSSLFCEESEWGGPPFKCFTFLTLQSKNE